MKRIANLSIENFQSHERSELAFGPGLNVIIGPSDSGKSAVLRALRWALYNEPRGSEFVRAGARECRVTVTMSDGAVITRELLLSKSGATARHRYIVREPGGEPQVFEAFGAEVPLEVTRAHGMEQVLLDTDKKVVLSLGSQLEGPFLLTEPGSLRARAIGRLLGVHVVDAAQRGAQRDLRAARLDQARLEREAARLEEELEPYADIPEAEGRLTRAEALLARAELLSQRLERLSRLGADLERVEQESTHYRSRLAALGALEAAEARAREAEERTRRIALLSARLQGLSELQERLAAEQEQARQTEAHLQSSLAEYGETLRRLGRCPTCLQPVRPEAIPAIIASLAEGIDPGHEHTSEKG
ncbi:MAG: AAA family ATPase [Bacillota bacterium]